MTEEVICELARMSEGFSGAEIEQAVVSACFDAFAARRPLTVEDLHRTVTGTVPLSVTQAEQIIRIRQWAEKRAVAATSTTDLSMYAKAGDVESDNVSSWRGGPAFDF